MFLRTSDDVIAVGRLNDLQAGDARSARYLTVADGMGFGFPDDRFSAGAVADLWYRSGRPGGMRPGGG